MDGINESITAPSFLRSMLPSGSRISFPKVFTIILYAGLPICTTSRLIASKSTTTIELSICFINCATVVFPVAIPPVKPTMYIMKMQYAFKMRRSKNEARNRKEAVQDRNIPHSDIQACDIPHAVLISDIK
jgi:hypothetical protein